MPYPSARQLATIRRWQKQARDILREKFDDDGYYSAWWEESRGCSQQTDAVPCDEAPHDRRYGPMMIMEDWPGNRFAPARFQKRGREAYRRLGIFRVEAKEALPHELVEFDRDWMPTIFRQSGAQVLGPKALRFNQGARRMLPAEGDLAPDGRKIESPVRLEGKTFRGRPLWNSSSFMGPSEARDAAVRAALMDQENLPSIAAILDWAEENLECKSGCALTVESVSMDDVFVRAPGGEKVVKGPAWARGDPWHKAMAVTHESVAVCMKVTVKCTPRPMVVLPIPPPEALESDEAFEEWLREQEKRAKVHLPPSPRQGTARRRKPESLSGGHQVPSKVHAGPCIGGPECCDHCRDGPGAPQVLSDADVTVGVALVRAGDWLRTIGGRQGSLGAFWAFAELYDLVVREVSGAMRGGATEARAIEARDRRRRS